MPSSAIWPWSGVRQGRSGAEYVFRPKIGLAICVAWASLTLLWMVVEARRDLVPMIIRLPLAGTLGLLVFAAFGRPCVTISDDGVSLHNLFRNVWIPFGQMTDVTTQFCLTITDRNGRRHNAWAAPAAGRGILGSIAGPATRPNPFATMPGPLIDTTRSDADSVARAVRNLRSAAADPSTPGLDQVRAEVATPVLIPLAIGILLTVVVQLTTQL